MFDVREFLEVLMDVWNRLSTSGIVSSKDSITFSNLGAFFYNLGEFPKYDTAVNFLVGGFNDGE